MKRPIRHFDTVFLSCAAAHVCSGADNDAQRRRIPPMDGCAWIGEDGVRAAWISYKQIDDELIDRPTAFVVAPNKDALKMALKGIDVKAPGIL